MDVFIDILWIVDNILAFVASISIVVFAIGYFFFFDPKATTAGRLIFRFMLSLAGVICLSLLAGIFKATPESLWYLLSALFVYGYLAYTIISLAVFLVIRKWWPHKVKKRADFNMLQPRHTSEIPIIRKP